MPARGRNEISWNERFRRCLYYFLRDELDAILINEALIESYHAFKQADKEYPFVEMKDLKPRAKIISPEYELQKHFIVIFNEETLPSQSKNCIRFFDSNKITKENLGNLPYFDLKDVFRQRMRYFDDKDFVNLLRALLRSDFAVLIQRDPTVKSRYRFGLSHFHVRVDWPVAAAAEDLMKHLRYVSKDLYEKGEKAGEMFQQKLFEYYGFHHMVGGRRTAALVAAQFMQQFDFISTIYVASAESRTLFRISESGLAKYVLIRLKHDDIEYLAQLSELTEMEFVTSYLVEKTAEYGVGIFLVTYKHNEHSKPPADGKLRELSPENPWLRVELQLIVPPPWSADLRPLPFSRVYA